MARKINQLSVKRVASVSEQGYYADGGGLYLQVSKWGTKSWIFRYMRSAKSTDMGLGPVHTVSLADAREKATDCRRLLLEGIDPKLARDARIQQNAVQGAKAITFQECAEAYIKAHRAGWRSEKHAEQWTNTLTTYAYPELGVLPAAAVDTGLVLKVLEPIWVKKTETATRVRSRIERVIDWATARGYRVGENPARWKGHLDKLLPRLEKRRRVKHHAALPYTDVAGFIPAMRAAEATQAVKLAFEFLILTAARTSEVLLAKPGEVDEASRTWTVPAERMKSGREHRVPLSDRAFEIARRARGLGGVYLFRGRAREKPNSNMVFLMLLRRMKLATTAHGFRSSFRDWAADHTHYPREVCEMALAHVVDDQTEAAYRRGDLFEKRRQLMDAWARYCATPPATKGKVLTLKKTAA